MWIVRAHQMVYQDQVFKAEPWFSFSVFVSIMNKFRLVTDCPSDP